MFLWYVIINYLTIFEYLFGGYLTFTLSKVRYPEFFVFFWALLQVSNPLPLRWTFPTFSWEAPSCGCDAWRCGIWWGAIGWHGCFFGLALWEKSHQIFHVIGFFPWRSRRFFFLMIQWLEAERHQNLPCQIGDLKYAGYDDMKCRDMLLMVFHDNILWYVSLVQILVFREIPGDISVFDVVYLCALLLFHVLSSFSSPECLSQISDCRPTSCDP